MLDFEDKDVEIVLDSLDADIDWGELDILSSLSPSMLNTPDADDGLLQVNVPSSEPQQQELKCSTVDTGQTQNNGGLRTELATTPTPVQDSGGSVTVATNQAQNTEPAINFTEQATSSSRENPPAPPVAMDDSNLLPQLLPDSSAPLLNETQSSYLSPYVVGLISEGADSSIQDQDMTAMSCFNQWNPELFQQNTNFNGINHQSSSYLALLQQNPVEAGAGIDTGILNGQFMTNQISPSSPLQNHDINPHRAWNSQGPEPELQSTFVPTPPNLHDHQHAYRPMPPEPPVPFGYSPSYDNQNNHYLSQAIMANGLVQQSVGGSVQLSGGSLRVPDQRNEYNRSLDTPYLQRQSSTLYGPTALSSSFTSSQALSSRILGLSGTMTIEETSSHVFSSRASETARLLSFTRPERASGIQLQQVAPVTANKVTTQRDKGLPQSSSSRAQSSESILKILNQNDKATVTTSGPSATLQQYPSLNLQNGRLGQLQPPRRGRPPKRREAGESSSSYKRSKAKKVSSGTENAGTIPRSQEADKTPENVGNEVQNANPTNPSSAPSPGEFLNSMYNPAYERNGVSIDPYIRLFRPTPEK